MNARRAMKGKSKMGRARMLTAVLAIAGVLGFMSQMGTPAHAASSEPTIGLGANALYQGVNTSAAQTVWYADKAWRVIGYDGSGTGSKDGVATLLAAGNLDQSKFDETAPYSNAYENSALRTKVDAIAGGFSDGEQEAIVKKTLVHGEYSEKDTDCIAGDADVENLLLWPLSTKEANALNSGLRVVDPAHPNWATSCWWLRSPGYRGDLPAYVDGNGEIWYRGLYASNSYGVRPAFDLDLRAVLFTSAAEGGKSFGAEGADALKQTNQASSAGGWKATLLSGHEGFEISECGFAANGISVPYAGATVGTEDEPEYISAIITDKPVTDDSAMIMYYGRIKTCVAASDTVTIGAAGKLGENDHLYVFNEQCNGDKKTDYSSALQEVAIDPAVGAVAAKIWALPATNDMTRADVAAVQQAKDAYDALSEAQQAKIEAGLSAKLIEALDRAAEILAEAAEAADVRDKAVVDLAQLDNLLDDSLYTESSYKDYTDAYRAFTELVKDEEATAEQFRDARFAVIKAYVDLEKKADISDPEVETVRALINALPAADAMKLADAAAVQKAKDAYDALSEAQQAKIEADLTAKLMEALDRAAEIVAEAAQAEIADVRDKAVVDLAQLDNLVDGSLYTAASYKGYADAYRAFTELVKDDEATAKQLRDARFEVIKAYTNLEKKTDISSAQITGLKAVGYTGKAQTQKPVVTLGGTALNPDTEYKVSYRNNTNAGTATVIVTGIGDNHRGTATAVFKISQAANPLKIGPKTASVKYGELKKKAQTLAVTKVITFTKDAKDKKTYTLSSAKKGSKSFKKYFKVNKSTGKLTVKKGLKKGTYKVKVKVRATGNANYKPSAEKIVSFKVKVK